MNILQKYSLHMLAILGISTLMAGCVREDGLFSTDDSEFARKQTVKITDAVAGDVVQRARNVNPTIDTFVLLEVMRSPNNQNELNQPLTVSLTRDTSIIGRFNRANNTSFQELPASLYTVLGDLTNVTFQPGETSKTFRIRLDKTNLDLSKQYALAYKVNTGSTGAVASGDQGEVMYAVGVKNKYDGRYKVTGTLTDFAVSTITGYYPLEWDLVTSGPNSVVVYDNIELGFPGHLISSSGSPSYYGSFGLVVNFDPVTNLVTSVTNFYGQPAGNGRSAGLDPTGGNAYDPSSKTVDIKYFMYQPGTTIRAAFDETWEYIGPR
jgi:hypothetical protein